MVGAFFILLMLLCGAGGPAAGQPPPAPAGGIQTRGEFLAGGQWVGSGGSQASFFTDRYLRSGFNLDAVALDFRPAGGSGGRFDFATLHGSGFGNAQPYQNADFRAARRRLYDLRAGYRRFQYFFDLPSLALGLHPECNVNRSSQVSLKLFPERAAAFHVGYRRNQQYGTAFTTSQLILDTFQLSSPRRLASDEFRFGAELRRRPFSVLIEQSFVRFRDDTQFFPSLRNPDGFIGNRLAEGQRDLPTRILTPVTRLLGRRDGVRHDLTGRYIYSKADFDLHRFDSLLYRIGAARLPVRQILSSTGVSEKPSHLGSVTQSVELTDRLTLHHQFFFNSYTITGLLDTTGVLRMINERANQSLDLPVEERGGTVTGFKLARNHMDLELTLHRSLSLLGGYRYADRHLGYAPHTSGPGASVSAPRPLVTISHASSGGFAWIPSEKARLRADVEKSTSSSAFHRIEPLDSFRWRMRGEFRPAARLSVSGGAVIANNRNGTPGVNYDLDDRNYSAQAVYAYSERFLLTGGYNFHQIHSSTDVRFFLAQRLTTGASLYETDTHVAHADLLFPAGPRLTLSAGYQLVKDTGASLPLLIHHPRAGLTCRIGENVSIEAHWQHRSYKERLFAFQEYRAQVLSGGLRITLPGGRP